MANIGSWYDTINHTVVSGTSSADSIVINGNNVTIYGNAGSDYIAHQQGTSSFIDGGDDNDNIFDVFNGNGKYGSYSHSTINGGNGDDSIDVGSRYSTIYGGAGADVIYTWPGEEVHHIYIDAGNDADSIFNVSKYATIKGGAGNDKITNSQVSNVENINGSNSLIDGGSGNDSILNLSYNANSTLLGGIGQDSIWNEASNVTIDGGDDNDSITNGSRGDGSTTQTNAVFINGGKGDDYISDYNGINSIINGGTGNDRISLGNNRNQLIQYANGDGNDTVYNYDTTDTVHITTGKYATVASGSDVLVNVYASTATSSISPTGYIKLVSAASKILKIKGESLSGGGTSLGQYINNTINNKVLTTASGDDTIVNDGQYVSINSGAGNDLINNTASRITINGGTGDDLINLGVYVYPSGSIYRTYTELIQYANGDGNDTITNYSNDDTIHITSGSITSALSYGNDVVISVGEGSITLKDAVNNNIRVKVGSGALTTLTVEPGEPDLEFVKLTNSDKTPYTAAEDVGTIDGSARTKAITINGNEWANSIVGGTNKDVINGGADADTLTGYKGNDTLTGGSGADVFVYNLNDGADYITDYVSGEDVIQLGSGVKLTKAATVKGSNDITLTVTKGSMCLKNGAGEKITIIDADGNTTKQEYGIKSISVVDGDGSTINAAIDAVVETIDASARTQDVALIGNSKANVILTGSGDDEITTGSGEDTIVYTGGDDIITDYTAGQDVIKLDGVTITKAEYTGQYGTDLVLTTDKGTLTVENVIKVKSSRGTVSKILPPQKLTVIDADGLNVGAQVYGADYASTIAVANADGSTIKANLDVDYVNGKSRSTAVYLIGNDNNNTLVGGSGLGSITVKNGANKAINVIDGNGVEMVYNYRLRSSGFVEETDNEVFVDNNFTTAEVEEFEALIDSGTSSAIALDNPYDSTVDVTSITQVTSSVIDKATAKNNA